MDHVVGEQLDRGEPAGVGQLGKGSGEGDSGGNPDRALQRGGDHHRQADVLRDAQAGSHAAEGLHLEHRHVRGDPHVYLSPDQGEILDRLARLLDVLQTPGGPVQHRDRRRGFLDGPAAVRVHADPTRASEGVAHRFQPSLLLGDRLTRLGDLHIRGETSGALPDDPVRLVRSDGGHRHVHRDARPQGFRPAFVGGLASTSQPGRGEPCVVLKEGAELSPTRRPFEEHALAQADAAERGGHRDGEDVPVGRGAHAGPPPLRVPASVVGLAATSLPSRRRSTFPLLSSGMSSTTTSSLGAHGRGSRSLTKSRTTSRSTSREVTTTATTRCPQCGSGTPTISAASTPGCSRIRAATAGVGTLMPPETTTSSTLPSTCNRPSSSSRPRSEVTNHPSFSTCVVRSGRPSYPSNSTGPARRTRPSAEIATATPSRATPSYTQPPQVSLMP